MDYHGLKWRITNQNTPKDMQMKASTQNIKTCGTVKAVQKGKSIAISPYVKKTSKGADKGDNHTSKGAQNTTAK